MQLINLPVLHELSLHDVLGRLQIEARKDWWPDSIADLPYQPLSKQFLSQLNIQSLLTCPQKDPETIVAIEKYAKIVVGLTPLLNAEVQLQGWDLVPNHMYQCPELVNLLQDFLIHYQDFLTPHQELIIKIILLKDFLLK
jgi:hypothetical protein